MTFDPYETGWDEVAMDAPDPEERITQPIPYSPTEEVITSAIRKEPPRLKMPPQKEGVVNCYYCYRRPAFRAPDGKPSVCEECVIDHATRCDVESRK